MDVCFIADIKVIYSAILFSYTQSAATHESSRV